MKSMPNRFTTALPLLLLAPVALAFVLVLVFRPAYQRLTWEYGGRICHRAFVEGVPERLQHRGKGAFPSASLAVKAARPLAPYTDFPCEYRPGGVLFFALLRIPF